MNLNPEVIREVLLRIEAEHTGPAWKWSIGETDDYGQFYIAKKLREGGLIAGEFTPSIDGESDYIEIEELTFSGHQLLENIRDPEAWKAVVSAAGKMGGNVSVAVLTALAVEYGISQLRAYGILP